jgi:cysteine-rich repeat protein
MKVILIFLAPFLAACTCGRQGGEDAHLHEPNYQDYPDVHIGWEGPLCGNKIIEGAEECDDGNRWDCDGCSGNCTREDEGACAGDTGTDGETVDVSSDVPVADPPSAPEPQGGLIPVEPSSGEVPEGIPAWRLRVLWTGSYYAVLYARWCPAWSDLCLAMTRFDPEGTILSPEWIYEPVEHGIDSYDICWNGQGFGLTWSEGPSAYIVLLDLNGKLVRGPVRICEGCLLFRDNMGGFPMIGCGDDGYLVSYTVEVAFSTFYRWVQKVSGNLDLLDGAFIGRSDVNFTFGHGDGYRLIHTTDEADVFPPGWLLMLDAITVDLDYKWRSIVARIEPHEVDYDATESEVLVVFREGEESYSLAMLDPDDGRMMSMRSLDGRYLKVASLGGGAAAVLRSVDPCPEGNDSCLLVLSVVDPGGLESGRVPVERPYSPVSDCGQVPYDVVWTGSELGVVLAASMPDGGCRFFLQRFSWE